jgi:hypothetical protein
MKKILYGFIGLFLVIGIVAGTAYAIFTTSANVTGVVLGTATPGLVLCDSIGGVAQNCAAAFTFPDDPFGPLVPGGEDWADFFLKNNSNGGTTSGILLPLNLSATIPSAGGDWGALADAVEMKVCLYDATPANHCYTPTATAWKTLAQWNSGDTELPGNPLLQGATQRYTVLFRLPSWFDNTVAGKTITDMTVTFKGTQAL